MSAIAEEGRLLARITKRDAIRLAGAYADYRVKLHLGDKLQLEASALLLLSVQEEVGIELFNPLALWSMRVQ